MALRLTGAAKNASLDALLALLDAGSGPGVLLMYTGAQVGSVGGSEGGNTLLGTLTFSDPAFRAAGAVGPLGSGTQPATNGVAYADPITSDTNADASGTCQHFVAKDSNGVVVFDGSAGQGSGDANFDVNVIVSGGTLAVTSMKVSL